jgi:hypothetical protein
MIQRQVIGEMIGFQQTMPKQLNFHMQRNQAFIYVLQHTQAGA